MGHDVLFTAVSALADAAHAFADVDMSQPFHWRKHGEGVRLGLIGTHHELQELAAALAARRSQAGPPTTLVQQVLGQVHTAYRELQAALLGITDAEFDQEPAAGEWPLRIILGHIFAAERAFFSLIISGLAQQEAGAVRPFTFPDGEVERVTGSQEAFYDVIDNQPLATIRQHYDDFHQRVLNELKDVPDEQFLGPSPIWWEEEEYSLQYRLHRFEAHLRQHLVQIEKTLLLLNHPETEARRFLRLIFRALASVGKRRTRRARAGPGRTTGAGRKYRGAHGRSAASGVRLPPVGNGRHRQRCADPQTNHGRSSSAGQGAWSKQLAAADERDLPTENGRG